MYFVPCPRCGSTAEIPEDAVSEVRSDPWNVTYCYECELGFDYDDEEVQFVAEEIQPQKD